MRLDGRGDDDASTTSAERGGRCCRAFVVVISERDQLAAHPGTWAGLERAPGGSVRRRRRAPRRRTPSALRGGSACGRVAGDAWIVGTAHRRLPLSPADGGGGRMTPGSSSFRRGGRQPPHPVAPDVVVVDSIAAALAAPWSWRYDATPGPPLAAILHQPPGGIDHGGPHRPCRLGSIVRSTVAATC